MREFRFEHVFRAASSQALLDAFFDPEHLAAQDKALDIRAREVLEVTDRAGELRRVSRVVPHRTVPLVGHLPYVETATWRRGSDEIAIEITRSRVQVSGTYRLAPIEPGRISRTYVGSVSVNIALLGSRFEQRIVAELDAGMAATARVTQAWLDRVTSGDFRHNRTRDDPGGDAGPARCA